MTVITHHAECPSIFDSTEMPCICESLNQAVNGALEAIHHELQSLHCHAGKMHDDCLVSLADVLEIVERQR